MIDDQGRKVAAFRLSAAFFALAAVAGIVEYFLRAGVLDLGEFLLKVAAGQGVAAAAFMGSNAWAKQSEARVEVKRLDMGGSVEVPEEEV